MQWIVGHEREQRLVLIYIGHYGAIDSLQWNVKLTSKLDSNGVNTHIGLSGAVDSLQWNVKSTSKLDCKGVNTIMGLNGLPF